MAEELVDIGIDVSKQWLDTVVIPSGETWHTENNEQAIGYLFSVKIEN
jgi:transposase